MDLRVAVINILIVFAITYVLFGIILFLTQRSMMYFPNNQSFEDCAGFVDYEKINHKGTRMYYKEGSDKAIVYYHGNAGSACDRSFTKPVFEKTNATMIFVEYAGYSNDKRKPSRKLILKDVENVHDFMKEKKFSKIVVHGQSIGSGAASYHASLGGVDKLILATSFSSMADVAKTQYFIYPVRILLRENYDNSEWLQNYEGQVLIIHGSRDFIIPSKHSKKLYEKLSTEKKEYVLIEGRGHNDIWGSEEFKEKLGEFLINKK
ncbi:alpha/beta hydrolase [Bacteroidota bacterium]